MSETQSTDFYGYLPSKPAALFGIVYFGSATLVCIIQIIFGRWKHYWMITLALAAVGEAIGWGGRLWAHNAPTDWMPFMIQISSLIVSPVFISAADYVLFCKLVDKSGGRLFHISSKFFWVGFAILDTISLAIQTVGGVLVSSAQNYAELNHGDHIMLSGIIFQFSNSLLFVFLLLGTTFYLRKKAIRLTLIAGWPTMIVVWVSTIMVLVRNAYRIAELSDGWKGHLMRTEWYLIAFDMGPIAIAVGVFIIFNPCFFFGDNEEGRDDKHMPLTDSSRLI